MLEDDIFSEGRILFLSENRKSQSLVGAFLSDIFQHQATPKHKTKL